ncbi:MAG: biotin--[acetyl-CoA-carboxylase] ligase [Desulfosarcinaceae bacterium]|nr:biotin--[acetyl-CoA-carboxylase] ligase [Desulfosarcinaceae bacterium]
MSIRPKILAMMRETDTILSGESLSQRLGVSRVSVWKHIRKLQEAGYHIEAASQGYRLLAEPDLPFDWEFPECAASVHYLPETPSTMDVALEMARQGASHLSVVVAGRQTGGRGRLNRQWASSDGGLYLTAILRPPLHPLFASRMTFLAGVVLALTIQEDFGLPAKVKWPNDLLIEEQKVAGMLSQMESEGDTLSFVNVGIGLNVNNDPSGVTPAATSLGRLLGRSLSRKEILGSFLARLETRFDQEMDEAIIDEWKQHTITLGRQVTVVTTRHTVHGVAEDIDAFGGLRLRLPDGRLTTVVHGDCFLDGDDRQPDNN